MHKGQLQNDISHRTLNILGRFKLEMKIWLDSFPTPSQKLDSDEKQLKYDNLKMNLAYHAHDHICNCNFMCGHTRWLRYVYIFKVKDLLAKLSSSHLVFAKWSWISPRSYLLAAQVFLQRTKLLPPHDPISSHGRLRL